MLDRDFETVEPTPLSHGVLENSTSICSGKVGLMYTPPGGDTSTTDSEQSELEWAWQTGLKT